MDLCPKNNKVHCPLFDDSNCGVPNENCVLAETFECDRVNKERIIEMQKKFDALIQASQKVFRQFGISFEV
jgi:hypothetical protein